jgi:hypothetical protein
MRCDGKRGAMVQRGAQASESRTGPVRHRPKAPSALIMSATAAVYRPRNPQSSDYYRCVEDYFETFVGIYDEHFSRQYGFWRSYVEQVIYRYLDCGDLHNGFARVKCTDGTDG